MTTINKPTDSYHVDPVGAASLGRVASGRLARSLVAGLCLSLVVACDSDKASETAKSTDSEAGPEVVDLPEESFAEPEPIDWTPPSGDSYEDAIVAYDQARESKIGEHPGYEFAGDIWQRLIEQDHPPSLYHLGLLHYFGNGGREFNHNLTGEYVRKSAAFGYPLAYAFMALQNEGGDGALFLTSEETALENWHEAAAGGHCGAIKRLVKAYSDGQLGVSPDEQKVAELEQKLPDCKTR